MRRGLTMALAAGMLMAAARCRPAAVSPQDDAAAPAPILTVSAARAIRAPISSELRLLGTTVALRHTTLRSPAEGRVVGLDIRSGDAVRRGQVVAHIINREVEAAEAGLAVAEKLDPQEAASLKKSVKRYSGGPGIAVLAPEDAVVNQRLVSSGQRVADLDALADLIDPGSIYVEAQVPINELSVVRSGMSATVTSALSPNVDYAARVAAISPTFSKNGATAPARLDFSGPKRIAEAGAAVEVMVTTASILDATVVPVAALFQDASSGGFYLFVAGDDGLAHRRAVTLGIREAERAQIVTGVDPGQWVITSGGYALSDGLRVRIVSEHN